MPQISPSRLKKLIKARTTKVIPDFEENELRDTMIRTAGEELALVTSSSRDTITEQLNAIRQSISDFRTVNAGLDVVQTHVRQIDSDIASVVQTASESSDELQQVSDRMQILEEHFQAISNLVTSVNNIADQTNLLALNATIEAARAGEAGKGFAVVAGEVKELSKTTKKANSEINETLEKVAESVGSLSASVATSVDKMRLSVEAVERTRTSASTIEAETSHFGDTVKRSLNSLNDLDRSSHVVENEVAEIGTIGRTFSYLLELVSQNQYSRQVNPLERLGPLVRASKFRDEKRFSVTEPEYLLTDDDVLISATDLKGIITFANNNFYRIAEYENGELEGRPHNIIRHSDMPKSAFADLWTMIKAGKLWQGYVANRSKHGRLYWVKANVFPCYENGKIAGYLSIRTKPESEMVKKATEAYRRLP